MRIIRNILIFTLVGVVLACAVVGAQAITKKIDVNYGAIKKIVIDGMDRTPTDKAPFAFEGTTYVPLRYVGEALGKKVTWDGKTGTIYIGEEQKEHSYFYKKPFADITGVLKLREDIKGIALNSDFNWGDDVETAEGDYIKESITYNVNGTIENVKGTIQMLPEFGKARANDEENQFVSGQVIIYDESGNKLYESDLLRLGSDPINFSINTKNALKLKFELNLYTDHWKSGGGCIAIKELVYK